MQKALRLRRRAAVWVKSAWAPSKKNIQIKFGSAIRNMRKWKEVAHTPSHAAKIVEEHGRTLTKEMSKYALKNALRFIGVNNSEKRNQVMETAMRLFAMEKAAEESSSIGEKRVIAETVQGLSQLLAKQIGKKWNLFLRNYRNTLRKTFHLILDELER